MKKTYRVTLFLNVLISVFLVLTTSLFGSNPTLKELLRVRNGVVLADVGAGNGEWIDSLVEWVGPNGMVIATEVDSDKVDRIQRRVRKAGWKNVTVLLGDQHETGLVADCCDGVLLRLVYHHLEEPEKMVTDLFRSIKSEGLIAIIDFVPNTYLGRNGIPAFRKGHGVTSEEVRRQMQKAGFTFLGQFDEWDGHHDRFLLLFEK